MKDHIRRIVTALKSHDDLEAEHIRDVLAWIDSGEPIFRVQKPDIPYKHLVSYFVLYDEATQRLMLVDHIKANMWLPTGGHVEVDEHPLDAAKRELQEELYKQPAFVPAIGNTPLFVTVTQTRGHGSHIDVSLWYVFAGNAAEVLDYDKSEFNSYKWLTFDEVTAMDPNMLDPHMLRFMAKLKQKVAT